MKNHTPKIVGIVGGIGSGKSTIAKIFKNLGAEIIDADKLCHQLLNNKIIRDKIADIWPNAVGDDLWEIDRARLAKIVFSKKENIERLNKILHPVVIGKIKERISGIKRKKQNDIVVIDAALLEESMLSSLCNIIVFVNTKMSLRKKRCKEARDWDESEIRRREEFQIPVEIKKRRAQFIINNDNPKSNAIEQVHNLWNNFLNKT